MEPQSEAMLLSKFQEVLDSVTNDTGTLGSDAEVEAYKLGVANLGVHLRRELFEGVNHDGSPRA